MVYTTVCNTAKVSKKIIEHAHQSVPLGPLPSDSVGNTSLRAVLLPEETTHDEIRDVAHCHRYVGKCDQRLVPGVSNNQDECAETGVSASMTDSPTTHETHSMELYPGTAHGMRACSDTWKMETP